MATYPSSSTHERTQERKYQFLRRALLLLRLLQASPRRQPELAELLGLSRNTIYRDIKTLREIGVPVWHDPRDRTYFVDPGFCFPEDLQLPAERPKLLHREFVAQLPERRAAVAWADGAFRFTTEGKLLATERMIADIQAELGKERHAALLMPGDGRELQLLRHLLLPRRTCLVEKDPATFEQLRWTARQHLPGSNLLHRDVFDVVARWRTINPGLLANWRNTRFKFAHLDFCGMPCTQKRQAVRTLCRGGVRVYLTVFQQGRGRTSRKLPGAAWHFDYAGRGCMMRLYCFSEQICARN